MSMPTHRSGAVAAADRRRPRAAAAGPAESDPQRRRRDERERSRRAERLTIRTESTGRRVRLCVVDNGSGIPADELKNVFDAFWSTKAGGMGIGLAICQSIVAAHHGTHHGSEQCGRRRDVLRRLPVRQPRMKERGADADDLHRRRRRERAEGASRACCGRKAGPSRPSIRPKRFSRDRMRTRTAAWCSTCRCRGSTGSSCSDGSSHRGSRCRSCSSRGHGDIPMSVRR